MKKILFTKSFFFSFMILTLLIPGFSKEKTIASQWVAASPIIDGSYNEWGDKVLNFEKKISVEYAFKNDGENLFVLFIFKDPKYLSNIRATGITLWFNTEGKKKKNYGIKFIKKQVSTEAFISLLEQKKGPLSEEEKNNIRANPYYFLHNSQVISKTVEPSTLSSDSGEVKSAVFRSTKQEKMIVYEFAVPLTKLTEKAPGIGTEPVKTIKVGFEWGGMTPAMKEARMRRSANTGNSPPQANGPGGSWSKGSSYGRRMPRISRSPKKYTFWVGVQLAQNQ